MLWFRSFPRQNLEMAASVAISLGSPVWVEDPEESWIDGEVVEIKGQEVKISCFSGKTLAANANEIYPKDTEAPPCGVDDMTKLAYLHEPGVLQNLKSRYEMNEIYTYTGGILIAVNPFQRLPHLYGSDMMQQYKGAEIGELSPHPFAVADTAYRLMMKERKSQSILVSGESGAGKTESTKLLMRYLAYMGGKSASEGRTVEQQVLESNPVLEAFGNAKTVRNNNSSRFGKFVEIQFDEIGKISGAAVRTYLLEKSRVCQVSDPERNYHCFYMLCAAPPEDVAKFKVGDPTSFHYLNQSSCFKIDAIDDPKEYLETRRAMEIVGISYDEQDAIFRVVAAILHLGNVEFSKGNEGDSSQPKDEKSWFHLRTAAELFMCDVGALEDSLCKRVMITRGEKITKKLDPEAAALSRDALAKIVYSRLFDWLVNKINSSIGQDPKSKSLIGVLDIYGFESFKTNSFEQFCINLTNEKLQQHFNQHVFKMEQEEYTREKIDWSYIEFIDNQDVLDLIEKKPGGIIALLDEACMFPRSTHETFAQKLYQNFLNNKRFKKPKLARSDFTICHYAGDVTYQTELFLEKNKDYVVAEHQALLSASQCPFVSSLFPPLSEEASKTSKFSSIGSKFKQQLQSLLEALNTTEPHYIRCVKPNNLLKPAIFENGNVLQQLRCGGVLEAIRISCAGYPTRRTFDEFVDRFGILAPEVLEESYDEVLATEKLLEVANIKGYQIGRSKVFLRAGQMAELDSRRSEVLGRSASIIQRKVRSFLARKWFSLLKKSCIQMQSICRGVLARHVYQHMREEASCLRIQAYTRMHLATKAYKAMYISSITIQTGLRGMVARKELHLRRQTRAATIIQSWCRQYLAYSQYVRLRKAAITTQCAWRGRVARKELRKLKQAARETGALQAAKTRLEKQVEELTWRLQLEKRMRTDMEEAKNQESAKLHSAFEELQREFTKTKELLQKERESARDVPAVPVIQEIPVIDTTLVEKLSAENDNLKTMLSSLEKKIVETEKKYEETNRLCEERLKKALVAENQIVQLNKAMQSLQEKLHNMESENQILRKKAFSDPPVRHTAEHAAIPKTADSKMKENDNSEMAQLKEPSTPAAVKDYANTSPMTMKSFAEKKNESPSTPPTVKDYANSSPRTRKSFIERQNAVDSLISCVSKNIGFSHGKPVAAFTIYRCLLNWKSFEAERTTVFDRLIAMIGNAIEDQESDEHLAYWLSNTSYLLHLLQLSLKAPGMTGANPRAKPPAPTLLGRMALGFRSFSSSSFAVDDGLDVIRQVEAKYPALLFKQQLTAYMEKIYGILRDNVKKELESLLTLCIQAPRASKVNMRVSSRSLGCHSLSNYWINITNSLSSFLDVLKENHVPAILIQKIYTQIFAFINVQLFNSLLLRRECCSFSNGEYVKAGLSELEVWCSQAKPEYAGSAWDELKHIRQAVGFLVIFQKYRISLDEIVHDLCPGLSMHQLYRICAQYWDDKYNTRSVSSKVLNDMRVLMAEDSNTAHGNAYLLDDSSSIPFSVDEISSSLKEKELIEVEPAEELLQNPAFRFLKE